MKQANDFWEECVELHALVAPLSEDALVKATGFKSWTIETIIRHLNFWNQMAFWALTEPQQLTAALEPLMTGMQAGKTLPQLEGDSITLRGRELVDAWYASCQETASVFQQADPTTRCAWVGPSMSARSCITARQMETWAHGQAIYDSLGHDRKNTDRLINIVVLGVNTYDWTFKVRGQEPPAPKPFLSLISPSGDAWSFGDSQTDNCITGPAEAFAQVVTQTRHIADTNLKVTGEPAEMWMANAQCFAGGPATPPAPGTRFKVASTD